MSSVRGNPTKVERWRDKSASGVTTNDWLASFYKYDVLGNLRGIKDAGGHWSTSIYLDSFGQTSCPPSGSLNGQANVSKATNALGHNVEATYASCTGQVLSARDQNDINAGRTGTTYTYDLLGRPLTTTSADGGYSSVSYDDTPMRDIPARRRSWMRPDGRSPTNISTAFTELSNHGLWIR
jgi:YD repeat-containing protein